MPNATSDRQRATAPGAAGPHAEPAALPRMTYVLNDDWLDVLAGDDPLLRRRGKDGKREPNATAISAAAGLDRTTLTQIKKGTISLSLPVLGSLEAFLETRHGLTTEQARKALCRRVPLAKTRQRKQAVAA